MPISDLSSLDAGEGASSTERLLRLIWLGWREHGVLYEQALALFDAGERVAAERVDRRGPSVVRIGGKLAARGALLLVPFHAEMIWYAGAGMSPWRTAACLRALERLSDPVHDVLVDLVVVVPNAARETLQGLLERAWTDETATKIAAASRSAPPGVAHEIAVLVARVSERRGERMIGPR